MKWPSVSVRMGNLNYTLSLISAVVSVAAFYALFSGYQVYLWTVSPFLHPFLGMLLPAYILSLALGLAFGQWTLVAITPVAYVLALTVFWLTLCSHCGFEIGRWATYGFFALFGLPTFITAGMGVWIRALATKERD